MSATCPGRDSVGTCVWQTPKAPSASRTPRKKGVSYCRSKNLSARRPSPSRRERPRAHRRSLLVPVRIGDSREYVSGARCTYKQDEATSGRSVRGGVRRHAVHNGTAEVEVEHAHRGQAVEEQPAHGQRQHGARTRAAGPRHRERPRDSHGGRQALRAHRSEPSERGGANKGLGVGGYSGNRARSLPMPAKTHVSLTSTPFRDWRHTRDKFAFFLFSYCWRCF